MEQGTSWSRLGERAAMPGDDAARAEQHAGAIALEMAHIAAQHNGDFGALASALADYLMVALDTQAVAFYWPRAKRRLGRHRVTLHQVTVGSRDDTLPPSTLRMLKANAYRALASSEQVSRVIQTPGPDGQCWHVQWMATPIGTGQPWHYFAARATHTSLADAQARAHLLARVRPALALALALGLATHPPRQADELSQTVVQSAPRRSIFSITSEAILSVGEDYVIHETNPAFTGLMGWSEDDVRGRHCTEVLHCRDDRRMVLCGTPRCPLTRAFESESDARQPVSELIWESRAGKRCELSASVNVHREAHDAQAVIVARDVTALNAANRMRANFISMVSHELRTPLNSINGFLEIVAEGQAGPLNERQIEFLNYARVSTQQLATLVEDILFISKADSGQFQLRTGDVDVTKLVGQAIQNVQAAADKAEVTITCELTDERIALRGDELRLQQVLTNLLGNAVKFTPPSDVIRLRVARERGAAMFSVSDQGRGVPAEEQTRIFERFYQSEAAVRERSGGYGLGLAIAKLIVEQHGGRIWVESPQDAGATFIFTIPLTGA